MTWTEILSRVATFRARVFERKRSEPFYRGHANHTWKLQPGLFRYSRTLGNSRQIVVDEQRLYWRLMRLGAHLLPPSRLPWETLFVMQHHGVPTRLLDWTESFAAALWFALSESYEEEPCVWMLDPFKLNQVACGEDALFLPDYDFISNEGYDDGYEPYVVNIDKKSFNDFPHSIAAIGGVSSIHRLHSQRGVFTLHRDASPVPETDEQFRGCFEKVKIPRAVAAEARNFLALANVNQFTAFPDLDGLGHYLRHTVLDDNNGNSL